MKDLGEGNGNPLQYSSLENSMDRGAWRAAVHEVKRKDGQDFYIDKQISLVTSLVALW